YEIYIMNADGTNPRRVTQTPSALEDDPQWSPDGKMLLYTVYTSPDSPDGQAFDVFVINVDGTGTKQLLFGLYDKRSPSWSPDGTTVAMVRRPGFFNVRTDRLNVWSMKVDGTQQRQLTFNASNDALVPRWSPDGTMLTYSLQIGLTNELHIVG